MRQKNIVLVGFMGSGKSTVARQLAKLTGRKVISTDVLIVEQTGQAIRQIFEEKGEAYFRQLEKNVVAQAAAQEGVIIDCGGGVVLDPGNWAHLKKTGLVIYLSATPEFILEQIKGKKNRPLLNVANPLKAIKELLDQRQVLYAQADFTIASSDVAGIQDMCTRIWEFMQEKDI